MATSLRACSRETPRRLKADVRAAFAGCTAISAVDAKRRRTMEFDPPMRDVKPIKLEQESAMAELRTELARQLYLINFLAVPAQFAS